MDSWYILAHFTIVDLVDLVDRQAWHIGLGGDGGMATQLGGSHG
jgi:hypothetical protein